MSQRKPKGYLLLLTPLEVVGACKHAEQGKLVPWIADRYNLTLNQTIHMLRKEGYAQYIKWKRYGSKKYNWNQPGIKVILQSAVDRGMNDDKIAEMMETTFQAISRGRSTAGIVAYNRVIAKGHNSKREFSHIEGDKQLTTTDVLAHQQITMDLPVPSNNWGKQLNAFPIVEDAATFGTDSLIKEINDTHERITVSKADEVIMQQVKEKRKTEEIEWERKRTGYADTDGREEARTKLEEAGILKKAPVPDNFTVCFSEGDGVSDEIKQRIVNKMSWRSIAQRIQNPGHLYELEGHYYRQHSADTYSKLIDLRWVRSVTAKV